MRTCQPPLFFGFVVTVTVTVGAGAGVVGRGGSTASRGFLRGGWTTTATRSRVVKSTYGRTVAVRVSVPSERRTRTTSPTGTPGTYGEAPRDPKDTRRSP